METGVDSDEDDLTAVKTRREGLRAFAALVAEAIESIEMPESYIEAERAARYVTVADRMVGQLPKEAEADAKQARQRLRAYADRLLDKVQSFSMPVTFLEGERASRCVLAHDRMLTQLYEAPKLPISPKLDFAKSERAPKFAANFDADEDDRDARANAAFKDAMTAVNKMTSGFAAHCGYWPDGTVCEPSTRSDSHKHFDIIDQITMAQEVEGSADRRLAALITGRANAVVAARAWTTGRWPDGSPYSDEDDPEYYHVSDRFNAEVHKLPPDPNAEPPDYTETSGPDGFPWWLIRRVKKETG